MEKPFWEMKKRAGFWTDQDHSTQAQNLSSRKLHFLPPSLLLSLPPLPKGLLCSSLGWRSLFCPLGWVGYCAAAAEAEAEGGVGTDNSGGWTSVEWDFAAVGLICRRRKCRWVEVVRFAPGRSGRIYDERGRVRLAVRWWSDPSGKQGKRLLFVA